MEAEGNIIKKYLKYLKRVTGLFIMLIFCVQMVSSQTLNVSAGNLSQADPSEVLSKDTSSFANNDSYELKQYSIYYYDENGNKTEYHVYNADGTERKKCYYEYDDCNNIIDYQEWSNYGFGDENTHRQYIYRYNEEMEPVEKWEYSNGQMRQVVLYCIEDDSKYQVKTDIYNDKASYTVYCEPDVEIVNGVRPGWCAAYSYDNDKALTNVLIIQYDENGNIIYKGIQNGQIATVYGEDGKPSSAEPLPEKMAQEWKVTYTEDENGIHGEEDYYIDGNLSYVELFEEDEYGNRTKGFVNRRDYFESGFYHQYWEGKDQLLIDYRYYCLDNFTVCNYNEQGKIAEKIEFDHHDHYYDRTIESFIYNEEGLLQYAFEYRLNTEDAELMLNDGRCVKLKRFDTSSGYDVDIQTISVYDENGMIQEMFSFGEDGKPDKHIVYEQSEHGTIKLEYDKSGNLIGTNEETL